MALSTKMFDWRDKEIRHADEIYIAVVSALTLAMIVGFVLLGL
jgi:hypothetical protein